MTDCRNCRRQTDLYLCQLCTKELGAVLGELPWLLDQLEVTVVRMDKLSTGVIGRSSDNPSPINVGAMELARNLRGQLGTIIRDLCEARGVQPPAKAWSSSVMAEWIHRNLSTIACSEGAGETYRELRSGVEAVLAAINRTSRMYCGPCLTVVGHNSRGEDIECGADLYADRYSDNVQLEQIQCKRCNQWVNPREQLLATIRRRDLLPEAVLLETLDTLGEKVSRVKLYDWIRANKLQPRGYVHHGRIVPHRIQRGDPRVFSLSHARALRSQEAI
jgi:hypothetical protein